MKRILLLGAIFTVLNACVKRPNLTELEQEFFVATAYDESADFSNYATYFIPDSVAFISDVPSDPDKFKNDTTVQIINELIQNMNARGYTQVTDPTTADVALTVSLLKRLNAVSSGYPGYWWGYPGYWGGGYWGYPGYGYYYPYSYVSIYKTGTIVIDMVDLQRTDPDLEQLVISWNAILGEVYSTNDPVSSTLESINQAFDQSPYISKN